MRAKPVVSFFVCLSLAAAATAQVPTPTGAAASVAAAHGLWREGDVLTGGGASYRVEFRAGGAVYVPALPDAARDMPLRLSLIDVRRGGLVLARGGSVEPRRRDLTASYERPGGIFERFELRPDGIKHSLSIPAAPDGDGDLVARWRVATDLVAERSGDVSTGARWALDGAGGVSMGSPVAIDAAAATSPMSMTLSGDVLEMRVAHDVVESAAYPLLLDPPIGTFTTVAGASTQDPDVAYDASTDRYLTVWSRRLSQATVEVFGQLTDAAGTPVGPLLAIATGSLSLRLAPRVANVAASRRFAVVWQQATTVFGPWEVAVAAVAATNGVVSAEALVTSSFSNLEQPEVGGNPTSTSDDVLVVMRATGSSPQLTQVAVRPTGAPVLLRSAGLVANGARSLTVSDRAGSGHHVLAWVEGDNTVRARTVAADLNSSSAAIDVEFAFEERDHVAIGGDGRDFVLAYERAEATASTSSDVVACGLRWDGTTLVKTTQVVPIDADPGQDERTPAVGDLGGGLVLVAWSEEQSGFLNYDLQMQTFDLSAQACGQRHAARSSGQHYDGWPAIGTQAAAGGSGDEALVLFSALDNTTLASSVLMHRFEAFGGGNIQIAGPGCGMGGTISAVGPFAVGNLAFEFGLDGADPTANIAFLVLGVPGDTFTCGSCVLTNTLIAFATPMAQGSARINIPQPCAVSYAVGFSIEAQWVVFGSNGGGCPVLRSLSASPRMVATLGY